MTPSALHPSLPRALVVAIAIAIAIVTILIDHGALSPSHTPAFEPSRTLDPSRGLDPAHLLAPPELAPEAAPVGPVSEPEPMSPAAGDGS